VEEQLSRDNAVKVAIFEGEFQDASYTEGNIGGVCIGALAGLSNHRFA
jgi:hypothetical protein